jgi:hypothetical protein
VLIAFNVQRATRLTLNDHIATVLALNPLLNLTAARLTLGSSTLRAPDAHRR